MNPPDSFIPSSFREESPRPRKRRPPIIIHENVISITTPVKPKPPLPPPPAADPPRTEYRPPVINRPRPPEPGFFFPGRQAEYHRNQTADVAAKTELRIAQETSAARLELAARATDHELAVQPTRLHESNIQAELAHESIVLSHELVTVQNRATQQLTSKALDRGLDLPNFGLVRVDEEKLKTEVKRAAKLARIEVLKAKKIERNRLLGYQREVHIDMQAALGMHMMDVEKLDYLGIKISRLRAQNADPERITAMEKVRDQMERHLLEAAHGEDMETANQADDSPSGN